MLLLLSRLCLLCSSSSLLSLLLSCLLVTNGRNLRRLFFFLLSAELSETDVDEIDAFVFTCLRCGVGPLPLVVDVCRFGLGVLFVYSSIRLSCRRAADGVVDDAIDESVFINHYTGFWLAILLAVGCWLSKHIRWRRAGGGLLRGWVCCVWGSLVLGGVELVCCVGVGDHIRAILR